MDEPFSALDPQTRQHMQQHLQQILANINLTVLFVTHDLDEALILADRIMVLAPHPGRIQTIMEVPLPRERPPSITHTDEYQQLRQYLESYVHGDDDEEFKPLPIPNMVPVEKRSITPSSPNLRGRYTVIFRVG